ncbi:MAG: nucleoside hydrolase [Phycisphaerae bacterium]|nr:nucleoside hydrolase [Phycisphaerae bacterium]
MATPLLIDTDMGVDDAVAVSLALASGALDVRALVGVGGNVELDQVMKNIGGLLKALDPPALPVIGRGLDPPGEPVDRRGLFGRDGLGECGLPLDDPGGTEDFKQLYERTIEQAGGELTVLATGPLSNLAAVLDELPGAAKNIKHICLTGGAVWTSGNAGPTDHAGAHAEFNFYRDPRAAAKVLTSGLPITVTPLDVAKLVCLDESHVAHLAASGYRTGEVLARMLHYPMEQDDDPAYGKCRIHAAVAAGSIIWPDLFLKTRMRLDIVIEGREAGRCKPALGGDKSLQVSLLTAVNAVDLLENLLESLCHKAFIV